MTDHDLDTALGDARLTLARCAELLRAGEAHLLAAGWTPAAGGRVAFEVALQLDRPEGWMPTVVHRWFRADPCIFAWIGLRLDVGCATSGWVRLASPQPDGDFRHLWMADVTPPVDATWREQRWDPPGPHGQVAFRSRACTLEIAGTAESFTQVVAKGLLRDVDDG